MISRRYLRTKVMQAIFAYEMNNAEDLPAGEKKLIKSIENCYTLFLYFFSLFPSIKNYMENRQSDLKNKMNPTYEDLHPNTKFIENKVIEQIENNSTLQKKWNELAINWGNQVDFLAQIAQEITQLEEFRSYMENEERSYQEDKKIILNIIEKVFAQSELLHWFFEEKNVHWFDDYNEALLMFYKNVSNFKQSQGNEAKILPLYKDEKEDIEFYKNLYRKTIFNDEAYFNIIEKKLKNWEAERVMGLDMILMKMALCEFLEFPTIPVKVTINEYIELAKTYSSAKSGFFINGLLDKIITELKEEGKLHKIGQGLLNN